MKFTRSIWSLFIISFFALALFAGTVWEKVQHAVAYSPPDLVFLHVLTAVLLAVAFIIAMRPVFGHLRHLHRNRLRRFTCAGAFVSLLLLFFTPLSSQAVGTNFATSVWSGSALSNVVTIGNTVSSNLPSTLIAVIPLQQGKGLAVWPYYAGAQSTNSGVMGFFLSLSYDNGSTYTTTTPLAATSTGNGAAAVRDYTYFPPTTLNGATHAKLVTFTNAVAQKITTTITNVYWSIPK